MTAADEISWDIQRPDPIIEALATYGWCSVRELAVLTGLGHEAITQRLRDWRDQGVMIVGSESRGFTLDGAIDLLDPKAIVKALAAVSSAARLDALVIRQTLGSTNDYLRQCTDDRTRACLAEQQTAGRGRLGKDWVSPYGVNLYLSVKRRMNQPAANLSAVSLAVGVALAQVLERLGVSGLGLKWPNDLWVANRKLGGILNEMTVCGPSAHALVGLGLNMRMDHRSATMIDQPWTCLMDCLPGHWSRSTVAVRCLAAILEALARYDAEGFAAFREGWARYDLLAGRRISLCEAGQWRSVEAHGVAADGSLKVTDGQRARRIYAGEASLRP